MTDREADLVVVRAAVVGPAPPVRADGTALVAESAAPAAIARDVERLDGDAEHAAPSGRTRAARRRAP